MEQTNLQHNDQAQAEPVLFSTKRRVFSLGIVAGALSTVGLPSSCKTLPPSTTAYAPGGLALPEPKSAVAHPVVVSADTVSKAAVQQKKLLNPRNTTEFTLSPDAFWGMCGPEYEASIRPTDLLSLFGDPINDGDAESLGSYVFRSPSGEVAIIYYRAYDLPSMLLKIFKGRFWRSTKAVDFTVGAENSKNAALFCAWLSSRVKMSYRRR